MVYGARLESVLGATPHGFESRSLRQPQAPVMSPGRISTAEKPRNRAVFAGKLLTSAAVGSLILGLQGVLFSKAVDLANSVQSF